MQLQIRQIFFDYQITHFMHIFRQSYWRFVQDAPSDQSETKKLPAWHFKLRLLQLMCRLASL
jgi:hypothetical protein